MSAADGVVEIVDVAFIELLLKLLT